MGGRGGNSGKNTSMSSVGSGSSSSRAIIGGGGGSSASVGGNAKPFTPSKISISKMSDKKLREEYTKALGHYYASGKSGISFGNHDPYKAAAALVGQSKMGRARMEKEYKKMLKKIS